MGVLSRLIFAPVKTPASATLWGGKKIHEAAERELNDPAAIRQALVDLEAQLLAGEIDEDTYDAAEHDLLARLGMLS